MPTPEEIKKIAREVANKIEPKKGFGGESYWIRTATEIIEKIVEDYCIVPKSKLAEKIKNTKWMKDHGRAFEAEVREDLITALFGSSLFNEE